MPTRSLRFLTALLAPLGYLLAQSGFPDKCGSSPLPFDAIKVSHPIDKTCTAKGKDTSPPASQTQNLVKNNFCASGLPETFTPKMLVDLQAKTHLASGHGKEPENRKALQDLGEGKLIRMKLFMIEAHHADLGAGESVNCNGGKEADNDIHIAFGDAANTEECSSVTAEISPHFRPASWNEIGHFETFNPSTKHYKTNPAVAARLQAHPYRVTGQLFFDASHTVCPCGTSCTPVRASLWEIHPVYNIEVCKTGTACNVSSNSDWMPFDDWWKNLPPLKPLKGDHTHPPHENSKQ